MSKLRFCLPLAIAALASCQKQTTSEPAAPAPGSAAPAAPAAAAKGATGNATIAGTVKLTGTPPEMAMTKRQADPFCAKTPTKEEDVVVGAGGGLKNVVVRVIKGLSGRYDPPAAAAGGGQSGGRDRPPRPGVRAGQPPPIKKSGQT